MDVINRVERLRRVYILRKFNRPQLVFIPSHAVRQLAAECSPLFAPMFGKREWGFDLDVAENSLRDSIAKGEAFLCGLKIFIGDCFAVGVRP